MRAAMAKRTRVYLDVAVAKRTLGRVVVVLRDDVVPKTCENFRKLCEGAPGVRATYRGTRFHRIIPGFMCQGGDYERGDGTGGQSAFGGKFEDENFVLRHERAGVLSMANAGPNTNGSQFFITNDATPWLDGKHVVFGHVEAGMEVVRAMEGMGNADGKPKKRVHIVDCGVLDPEPVEPVGVKGTDRGETQRNNAGTSDRNVEGVKTTTEGGDNGPQADPVEERPGEAQEVDLESMNPRQRKFFELRLKLNQARNLNNKAVVAEKQRSENPGREQAEQKRKVSRGRGTDLTMAARMLACLLTCFLLLCNPMQMYEESKKKWQDQLQSAGISSKEAYRLETSEQAERKYKKQKKKDESFGWDAYNQDSTYRAYEKRVEKMEPDMETYERMKREDGNFYQEKDTLSYGKAPRVPEENVERMVNEFKAVEEKRAKFSRRRAYRENQDIDHINKRNEAFNKKLDRAYGRYTDEIKANLERGTALPDS